MKREGSTAVATASHALQRADENTSALKWQDELAVALHGCDYQGVTRALSYSAMINLDAPSQAGQDDWHLEPPLLRAIVPRSTLNKSQSPSENERFELWAVKQLLKAGASANAVMDRGGTLMTPLMRAGVWLDGEIGELLINAGANIHVKNHEHKDVFWLLIQSYEKKTLSDWIKLRRSDAEVLEDCIKWVRLLWDQGLVWSPEQVDHEGLTLSERCFGDGVIPMDSLYQKVAVLWEAQQIKESLSEPGTTKPLKRALSV